ncbi:MAG: DNA repair exonuclease [Methanosphaera sp.]|nr:DNA repair exonuclease [Methanosphaera sp.]
MKMTVKIAHLADTHLGYRQYGIQEREDDFYDAFKNVVDDIIEKDVDYVIHCGDLFEQPKPPIKALLVAQECFNKLMENNIEVYVIAGNHDILQRRKTSLPQELFENDNFHIISTKNNHHILKEDIYLTGLPYLQKVHEAQVKDMLDELVLETREHKHSILMLHGGVSKLFGFECEFENDTIPEGFDYYALGHIHERKMDKFKNGLLCYPGSTEIKNKGEISEYENKGKGYVLLSVDDSVKAEYVNIDLERKFIVCDIKYSELDMRLDEISDKINNEILVNTAKKPVLILNIKEGDFERSEVSGKIYDKLGDISLSVRLSYEPTIIIDDHEEIDDLLSPKMALINRINNELNEHFESLGVDLYSSLAKRDMEEAKEISDTFYEKFYNKGEENDNK